MMIPASPKDRHSAAAERMAIVKAVARTLGWDEDAAYAAGRRAHQEALAGFENDYAFGGWLSMGLRPDGTATLSIHTYTGRTVDPRETGIAGASTLD
jgi:hypothetical protein